MKAVVFGLLISLGTFAQSKSDSDFKTYIKANKLYKKAVYLSQVRLKKFKGKDICSEEAYQVSVMGALKEMLDVTKGTSHYKNFLKSIKTNADIKTALKDSINYRLLVSNEKIPLADRFMKSMKGVVLFGPAPGVYGSMSKIEFLSNKLLREWNLNVDTLKWESEDFEYTMSTKAGGKIKLPVVTYLPKSKQQFFLLKIEFNKKVYWWTYEDAKSFEKPGWGLQSKPKEAQEFTDFPEECSA